MVNVLFPINLDNWNESIPSKFREIVNHCQSNDIHFFAGSKAQPERDQELASERLWKRPNLSRIGKLDLLTKHYDITHNGRATATSVAVASMVRLRGVGRTKHIFTVSIEPSPEQWNFRHAQFLTNVAHLVIANSQAVADSVQRYFHRVPDHIIPNGVDTDFFSPSVADVTTRLHYKIRDPQVLFVGDLQPRKRPDLFVSIARCLPEVDFVMVGSNPRNNPFALNDLPQNVKVLGLVPKQHVRDLLATSHALVFPSELEGLPNAVLEAVAMGLPVLAQAKTSLPEIIQDGKNGWLLDAQKVDLWVDLIQDLITWDNGRRRTFRDTARATAIRTYSWAQYTQRHVEVYHQLCGTR